MGHNIVNFDAHAGADETITITVVDNNSSAVNIAGASVDFAVNHRGPNGSRIMTLGSSSTAQINITDAASGIYQVSFGSTATIDLCGWYQYQSKINVAGVNSYVIEGLIEFRPSLFSTAE